MELRFLVLDLSGGSSPSKLATTSVGALPAGSTSSSTSTCPLPVGDIIRVYEKTVNALSSPLLSKVMEILNSIF